jgi:cyclophilin family peptidyl-prolyl cis-trans isomerase
MKASFYFVILLSLALISCSNKKELLRLTERNAELENTVQELEDELGSTRKSDQKLRFLAAKLQGVKGRFVTNYGDIEVKFFPNRAPLHCFAFITRAESGFYDNMLFHRVIKNFMLQSGDPNSKDDNPYNDGIGGPLVMIPHEFSSTHHGPGILSTARQGDKSVGAGSQFFIVHSDYPSLNNEYTVFGEVTKGMNVVDKIAQVETNQQDRRLKDRPIKPVRIKTIEVYR